MATRPLPEFSSPELQATFESVRSVLEGAETARTKVSEDIKALEGYLQGLALKTSFRYSLGKEFHAEGEYSTWMGVVIDYEGSPCLVQEEALLWDLDKSGKARLLYEMKQWSGFIDVDSPGSPYSWDESSLKQDSKPLIETKFEIRKRMYTHLAAFLSSLAREVAIDPASGFGIQSDTSFDIPF